MKSIKSKIWVGMLSVVLIGSTLIGVFTALLNARGIDALLKKTRTGHSDGGQRGPVANG